MKGTRFILMAIAAFLLLTSSRPVRVACIGDSITYGSGIEDRENQSYPAVLQNLLGDGYEVRNFGYSARVMLLDGDYPFMKEGMYQEAKDFLPDIVTIMLGTNDSKPHNWKHGDKFYHDYLLMVDELRRLPSHPTIYLCLPPKAAKDNYGICDSTIVSGVIPEVKKVADYRWLDIIDTYSTLANNPEKFPDGIHPNPEGAAMLAEAIFKAFEKRGDTGRQGKRVVFIGDSITDGDWGKADGKQSEDRNSYDLNHTYGHGYQAFCAAHFLAKYPERKYKFFDRGISGNRLEDLAKKWDKDVMALHPDVLSILVGVNDTWRKTYDDMDFVAWEKTYRELLDKTLAEYPDTRIVLCTPFLEKVGAISRREEFDGEKKAVEKLAEIVRSIAKDYNATLVPFDTLIADLVATDRSGDEKYWTWDGIHPTYAAHSKMADLWIKSTKKIMK